MTASAGNGRLGGRGFGDQPLLLLTTKGAQSGRSHTTPVVFVRDGDRVLVLASNYGAPRHPDWFHYLRAHPDVHVEVGGEEYDAIAVVPDGPERDRLFTAMAAHYPWLPDLQNRAGRKIPVVALVRA
jgi:deazaflavin-dependent oxidoreductase (nitroreductase family)